MLEETSDWLVLNKAPGLLSQSDSSKEASLVELLKERWSTKTVFLVHRLDRNTSGAMIVARTAASARSLSQQLKSGVLKRVYEALLVGVSPLQADWAHHLVKNAKNRQVSVFRKAPPREKSQEARLSLQQKAVGKLSSGLTVSLCLVTLETGRSHQIRAQAAAEGFPVLGDRRYGLRHPLTELSQKSFARTALHSRSLVFRDPRSQKVLSFQAEWPDLPAISWEDAKT